MKKILLIPGLLFIGTFLLAMNNKYEKVMLEQIDLIYNAETVKDYQNAINKMERIGDAETNKWEPYYYASFANIMISNKMKSLTDKDRYLDQAQTQLDKALALEDKNVELVTLQGFIHTMRLAADPATRGQQYSGLAFNSYNRALAIDSKNPRALVMMAQMKLGTAQFFGADTSESCEMAKVAFVAFDNYKSDNALAPVWGRGNAEQMAKQCE